MVFASLYNFYDFEHNILEACTILITHPVLTLEQIFIRYPYD